MTSSSERHVDSQMPIYPVDLLDEAEPLQHRRFVAFADPRADTPPDIATLEALNGGKSELRAALDAAAAAADAAAADAAAADTAAANAAAASAVAADAETTIDAIASVDGEKAADSNAEPCHSAGVEHEAEADELPPEASVWYANLKRRSIQMFLPDLQAS